MRMTNVPYHEEVVRYAKEIISDKEISKDYAIACEHAHSCSVLIASKKFFINGRWNTWIDYDRFHELVQSGKPFTSLDYMAETPEWSAFGSAERGFAPTDTRFYRNKTRRKMEAQ